jgi:rsbT antagonist protein RsbS
MLDFSAVDICDSFFGRFIQSTADMVGLMGADVIVSGLQDAVIETMVELGMILSDIHAVLDLDDALALSRTARRNMHFFDMDEDEFEPITAQWGTLTTDSLSSDLGGV